jgi:hypothetical protein
VANEPVGVFVASGLPSSVVMQVSMSKCSAFPTRANREDAAV